MNHALSGVVLCVSTNATFRSQPRLAAASLNWTTCETDVHTYVNDMTHVLLLWNDELIVYLGLHDVTPDEFEEVVLYSMDVQTSHSSARRSVFGETSTGKYLACVFEYLDRDQVVLLTVYEVD